MTPIAAGVTHIDPREFVYRPTPAHFGMLAADLWGSARDQWRWWYREQRMKRTGRQLIVGEIGCVESVRFVENPRPIIILAGISTEALELELIMRKAWGEGMAAVLIETPVPKVERIESFILKNVAEVMLKHLPDRPSRPTHERIAAQKGRQHRLVRRP